jgi:hypothetical protein
LEGETISQTEGHCDLDTELALGLVQWNVLQLVWTMSQSEQNILSDDPNTERVNARQGQGNQCQTPRV